MNAPKQSVHVHKRRWFGLLVLRIGLGVIFIAHGYGKIAAMQETSAFFGSIGFGALVTHVVAYVELLGGVALLFGIFTQVAATILALIMSVVLLYVKQHASITGMHGNELELALFVSSVALAFMGAGRFSLGAHLCRCCKDGTCGGKKWCWCHAKCGGEHCGVGECDKCEDCMEGALCTEHEADEK
jgi:putative oxidoreductase